MTDHVQNQLWDWLQGAVSESVEIEVRAHLKSCESCQRALDSELSVLAKFEAARRSAPRTVRGRLLDDATTLARFSRYTHEIASLADVDTDTAQKWLSQIEDSEVWSDTALEDMHLFHIDGGPAVENAIVGFVRLQPETSFPEHTHVGSEAIFIIQGVIIDENGERHRPGARVERDPGSTHEITAAPGHPAVYLSVVHEGIEVFGMRFGPDSLVW